MFDEDGCYTILRAGSYVVADLRVKVLAEITYMRRDLDRAYEFIAACAAENFDDLHPLLEESLWNSSIVMYGKVFTASGARENFDPTTFVKAHLGPEALRVHEYVMRIRNWMIAHDDGLGETKELCIYLPLAAPQTRWEVGLQAGGQRVVALGSDIAKQLEPHFQEVRDLFFEHENAERERLGAELVRSQFSGLDLIGPALNPPLEVDIASVLAMPARPRPKRRKDPPKGSKE